uniref:ferroxidase n=1 Tax=Graphocephala atropunctata TaxID=36148 RepID=A0A1B6LML7_9HEMI
MFLRRLQSLAICHPPKHICKSSTLSAAYIQLPKDCRLGIHANINCFTKTATTAKVSMTINHLMFSSESPTEEIDNSTYESVCEETLDSLCERFEDIIESTVVLKSADVTFGDGVLTVKLGKFGTYVINRQSPNRQIWLSSPTSGPKRYDFVRSRNGWVYRHDNRTLHSLLQEEISAIVNNTIDLSSCAYSGDCK